MASRPKKVPTSRDVAQAAGVSQSTVSYVLTGARPVAQATRDRVLAAMADLDFRPNAGARLLAGQRSGVLGAVLPFTEGQDLAATMELITAIATTARANHHDLLLAGAEEGPDGLARLQRTGFCDGVFLFEVAAHDPRLDVLRRDAQPAVVIGLPADTTGLLCVDLDFEAAGALALEELAMLGHRTVLVLAPPEDAVWTMGYTPRFLWGARRRAAERGVELVVLAVDGPREEQVRLVREAHAASRATGVIIHHDMSTALAVLADAGMEVGAGVGVVALGRTQDAERQRVPLTSIPLEPEAVAQRAVAVMLARLDAPQALGAVHLIPPRLVRRASSTPPG